MDQFICSVRDDQPPAVGDRDGLVSVLIGLAAQESIERGRPARVSEIAGEN